jgi:hypothetical protein
MRRLFVVLIAVGTVTLGLAQSAWAIAPANGVYQGIVDGSNYATGSCGIRHNEGEGYFRVKRTSSGKKIVPPGTFSDCEGPFQIAYIVAPKWSGSCDPYNATIATRIPISQGAFDFRGYTAQAFSGEPRYHIHFKGAWVSQTKAKGFTQTARGSCVGAKEHWTMRLVS